ncbi:GAF domain-containing sensor histidine kinase [Nocardioides sp. GY 10127]|uniref:GAF domain-containing sensor histidine kinase n=1 Tax=Nocardioides sp. GY 10127 TaxID=2569762 RepID=UPI0010A80984|nr:GAF domain-containing sensor histidine kinase [Nocardioides sp. GY 10127]TIC80178.1 GAF domain-containing sensor histidine kinase [Nocardioides sp. GY 10127]
MTQHSLRAESVPTPGPTDRTSTTVTPARPEDRPAPPARRPVTRRPDLVVTLHDVAQAVATRAGFVTAAVSLFRGSEELEFVTIAGDPDAQAALQGDVTPTAEILGMLAQAEDWGPLRFVPHERALQYADHVWTADEDEPLDEGAWHPYDLLMAPVRDERGTLVGLLWLDRPVDGRRPGRRRRVVIETHVNRAVRALAQAVEREHLTESVRLAGATRRVVRTVAHSEQRLDQLVRTVQETVRDGFGVDEVHVALDEGEVPLEPGMVVEAEGHAHHHGYARAAGPACTWTTDRTAALLDEVAARCWRAQRVAICSPQRTAPGLLSGPEHTALVRTLEEKGAASLLLAPIGGGGEVLGHVVLVRHTREDWSDEEADAALDIGHDLGRAVLNHRLRLREAELARYRQQVVRTMAHELKNPLAAVSGFGVVMGDLVDDARPMLPTAIADQLVRSLAGIDRASERLTGIVGDLLALARLQQAPEPAQLEPVDLTAVVAEVLTVMAGQALPRDVRLASEGPDGEVLVRAERDDLVTLVTNLVGNAVKYSHDGGQVRVRLTATEDDEPSVALSVSDDGIGIPEADRLRLFEEFFRSSDPVAADRPGSGLGLAIVRRTAERYGGVVDVASTLGRGSTFTVALPGG